MMATCGGGAAARIFCRVVCLHAAAAEPAAAPQLEAELLQIWPIVISSLKLLREGQSSSGSIRPAPSSRSCMPTARPSCSQTSRDVSALEWWRAMAHATRGLPAHRQACAHASLHPRLVGSGGARLPRFRAPLRRESAADGSRSPRRPARGPPRIHAPQLAARVCAARGAVAARSLERKREMRERCARRQSMLEGNVRHIRA